MKRGKLRGGAVCAALLLSLFAAMVSTSAAVPDSRVIRVAYPIQQGQCEVDEKGNYSGYTYEYLEEIAQYTGWDFEFVQGDGGINESFGPLMDQLEAGELDLMGGMVYSDAMAELVDFASQSYGTAYTTLEVLSTNTAITKDSYQTMQDMTIAVMASSKVRVAELEQFCRTNGIRYQLARFDTLDEMTTALHDGAVDAILSTDLTRNADTRIIAKFSPRPFYFVTTKGNAAVLQKLNKAILSISEVDPAFSANLMERYFGRDEGSAVFSDADQNYIREAPTLRVGVMPDGAPYQYRDEKTGAFRGIAIELLDAINEMTGLTFELVPVESRDELQTLIEARSLDLVASLPYRYQQGGVRSLALTRPYATPQNLLLGNTAAAEEGLRGKRVALPRDLYGGADTTQVPSETVRWYDDLNACVAAVRGGEADYTYGDGYTVQYLVNLPENRRLHMIPLSQENSKVSLGVVRPGNEMLLTVLNKSIINLSSETMQTIVYENITYQGELSFLEYIEANPGKAILAMAGVALVVILSMLTVLLTRVRASRQTALDLKKHYQLYALSNDHFFEYDFRKDRLMLSIREEQRDEQDASVFIYENAEKRDEKDERRAEFVRYVKASEDGTEELQCAFFSKEPRWLRVTTRRVYDGGVPAYVVGKFTDVDDEHREKDELLEQAQKDSLTQVYNAAETRGRIMERLKELPAGQRDAMVIVDIDYFKGINDAFGHFVGDQILQQVADAMRAVCGEEDFAGRLGGDEFVLYLSAVTPRSVEERCQSLRREILHIRLPEEEKSVTVSIGTALAAAGADHDELYQRADAALYEAKNRGRDRIAVAGEN